MELNTTHTERATGRTMKGNEGKKEQKVSIFTISLRMRKPTILFNIYYYYFVTSSFNSPLQQTTNNKQINSPINENLYL